ncbi:MAG: ABC transporter ATP-binding protein [Bacteroidales bacterium]|nr:ABC transporter ATP-binding protein [Bacteroidales bacterium]
MNPHKIIEITGLSKKFKEVQAVDDLSLQIYERDIYGLLGPNGSGKSTTIRMLLSLIRPDHGEIMVFGKSLSRFRIQILGKIGALVEKPDFYEYLSARKNMEILSSYSGKKAGKRKIDETLELVGLMNRAESKVKTYSKGMKQRLGLAQTMLNDPELLVLDEPAGGLDPSGNRDIRNLIKYLNREKNMTIILSSHHLQEVELVANRMIIIGNGKKIVEGNVKDLLDEHTYYTTFSLDDELKARQLLEESTFEIEKTETEKNKLRIFCKRQIIPEVNKYLAERDISIFSIQIEQNLEDYFLTLT